MVVIKVGFKLVAALSMLKNWAQEDSVEWLRQTLEAAEEYARQNAAEQEDG